MKHLYSEFYSKFVNKQMFLVHNFRNHNKLNMKILHFFWRTIILILTIITVSLANMNKVIPVEVSSFKYFDKIAHFCMYFSLSFMFFIENYSANNFLKRRWIIIETISLGVLIEFMQYFFTTNRTGDFFDAVFNTVGVLAGGLIFIILRRFSFLYKLLLLPVPHNK